MTVLDVWPRRSESPWSMGNFRRHLLFDSFRRALKYSLALTFSFLRAAYLRVSDMTVPDFFSS